MLTLMIPAKGGVGNSLLTRSFALNKKADLLIDGGFGRRGQDLHHQIEDQVLFDLFDYLIDSVDMEDAVHKLENYDLLLASQTRELREVEKDNFHKKMTILKKRYEEILVDLSHWQAQDLTYWLGIGDRIIIIAEDDLEAYRGIDQINFLRWQEKLLIEPEIIFNKVSGHKTEEKIGLYIEENELNLLGLVPEVQDPREIKIYKLGEVPYQEDKVNFINRLFRGVKND